MAPRQIINTNHGDRQRKVPRCAKPALPVRSFAHPLVQMQRTIGNQALGRLLQTKSGSEHRNDYAANRMAKHALGRRHDAIGGMSRGSARFPKKCACESRDEPCSECAKNRDERPQRKFFAPEEVTAQAGEKREEQEEERPRKSNSDSLFKTNSKNGHLPHAGDATIVCKAGQYVVDLGSWAGTPCGQPDCVTVHEESHIKDWKKRWPKGCKKDDGTNQPDGYLPKGGEGYDEFLKKSECDAHIADLKCAAEKEKSATGACKETWKNYINLTEKEKKKWCTGGC